MKSQGWTPIVADVNGTGKREAFVAPDKPIDPAKDKWVKAAFYGVMPSPKGDVIWGQAMGTGFSRIAQPSFLIRLIPGSDPAKTAVSEIFQAPEGEVWLARRGRRLQGRRLDGAGERTHGELRPLQVQGYARGAETRQPASSVPRAGRCTGCPDLSSRKSTKRAAPTTPIISGWTSTTRSASANDVPIACANGSEFLLALVDGKFVDIRIPYPLGFFSKNVDGRIDDPNGGLERPRRFGRHPVHGPISTAKAARSDQPKVFKVQMRPDPLAN